MGKKRKERCLAFLMTLAMMTGLFMGDAAGLLVKAEDMPASVKIGITTLETGWEGGGSSFYTGTICNDSWRR